jgi:hypothetical protein
MVNMQQNQQAPQP